MASRENDGERRKLIDALYELSKENFTVSDDTIIDKLYVHIENKSNGDDFLELQRYFGNWMEHVMKLWNSTALCSGVRVLFVRLLGLVGSKPHGFMTIKLMLPEIEKLLSSSKVQQDSCLMVPLLNDLALFLLHQEGLNWVLSSEVWKHAVKAFYEDRSIYVNRTGIKFISLLLSKVSGDQVVEVLNFVSKPLVDNRLITIKAFPNQEEHNLPTLKKERAYGLCLDKQFVNSLKQNSRLKNLLRAATFMCGILEQLLLNNSVLPIEFECNFKTDLDSEDLTSTQDCVTLLQLMAVIELSSACWSRSLGRAPCPAQQLFPVVQRTVRSLLGRADFTGLMDFCVFCLKRVHFFGIKCLKHKFCDCSSCRELETLLVQQLQMFLELHLICFCTETCSAANLCNVEGSITVPDLDGECLEKFNQVRSSRSQSFQYFHRSIFSITRSVDFIYYKNNMEAISSVVISSFGSMKKHLWPEKSVPSSSLLSLITLAGKLVESSTGWDFSRQLFTSVPWILERVENEDSRVTVNTLQLLSKILKTLMIPELIINSTFEMNDLTFKMSLFTPSLKKNVLNHLSWEIRDTTLEVYQLLLELQDLVPGLYSVVFYENIHSDVLGLAANDASAYVRSSALKFFTKAVRAKVFLHKISSTKLIDLAADTLLKDEMPEPRMAACDLLAAMYITDSLTGQGMPEKLYSTIFTASLKELDWEVKKATLRFWECAIVKHMADAGVSMYGNVLRSSDPAVKEDIVFKIITTMDTLSDIGCLKVIWTDVIDDSDISVSQEACRVIDNILKLDKDWNFIERIINNFEMDVDQGNLSIKKLSSKDFCTNICKKDWREKLKARKTWIEITCDDLPSLLDHILNQGNEDWDHNAVDCY